MADIWKVIAALVVGYLLGSLNTSVIVGMVYGKDIRNFGSKSAGEAGRMIRGCRATLTLAGGFSCVSSLSSWR